jgi:hypothetical protein
MVMVVVIIEALMATRTALIMEALMDMATHIMVVAILIIQTIIIMAIPLGMLKLMSVPTNTEVLQIG